MSVREYGECDTQDQLESDICAYARRVIHREDIDNSFSDQITWTVSGRLLRKTGKVSKMNGGNPVGKISWVAYKHKGWGVVKATVRWCIASVVERQTDRTGLHTQLETGDANQVAAPPKYRVVCDDCGNTYKRYKKGKLVKRTHQFRCGKCNGNLTVNDT